MIILMADVVNSSQLQAVELAEQLKNLVAGISRPERKNILSPLTITLGDEFQGLVADFSAGLRLIIAAERALISLNKPFQLRYALAAGEIATPINTKRAHGMIGPGLTSTRQALNALKNGDCRFSVAHANEKVSEAFGAAFLLYQSIVDSWKPADCAMATLFLQGVHYQEVAETLSTAPSNAWRRRKTLQIDQYFAAEALIGWLGNVALQIADTDTTAGNRRAAA